MKKAKKSKGAKKAEIAKKSKAAKKTKKAKKAKKTKKANKGRALFTSPLGCCTIAYDDGRSDEQIEDISKQDCIREARARRGIFTWNRGSCA